MKAPRRIDSIIIHCSDTPDDKHFKASDIEYWHKQRAISEPWTHFKDLDGSIKYIGYHYVVRRDGVIEPGRPERDVGCHCKGMNKSSLGICWVGRGHMADIQREALINVVAELCVFHGLSSPDVYGHFQFSKVKTCPNFSGPNTFKSIDEFRSYVEQKIREIK